MRRPAELDLAGPGSVRRGLVRPEAVRVGGREQRRLEEGVNERVRSLRLVAQQVHDAALTFDRAGHPGLLGPFHDRLMVRGGRELAEDRFAIGRKVRRSGPLRPGRSR